MNIAFIDGQNLHMSIKHSDPEWKLDLARFRFYLKRKYKVSVAYYFIGVFRSDCADLYSKVKKAGFKLKFRQHIQNMRGRKKGNVDSDIIFEVMKVASMSDSRFVIVSGDGDYKILIDYLIENNKLRKIIFPNTRSASSLYKNIPINLKSSLSDEGVRKKVRSQNEKASLGS